MTDTLKVRQFNQEAHHDIDTDIMSKRNGLFTFVLRVHDGNIVDYVVFESKSYAKRKAKRSADKASPGS